MSDGVGALGIFLISLLYALPVILFFFALRWAISGGIRNANKKREDNTGGLGARQILDERYARGEISGEEYRQVRKDIEKS